MSMAADSNPFVLEKRLELGTVQEEARRISQALAEVPALLLDGGEVARIDGSGLQLLLAMAKTARDQGKEVTWKQASDVLKEAVSLFGLESKLNFKEEK